MDGFRLVCWNMQRKLANWRHVEELEPDIICLQECHRAEALANARPELLERFDIFDDGDGPAGLVVGARKGLGARLACPIDRGIKYAIAIEVEAVGLRMLGAHSYNHRALDKGGRSPTPTLDMIAAHAVWLAGGRSLVAGDLNNAASFKKAPREPRNRFENVVRAMREAGLESVWHQKTGEAYGAESEKTFHPSQRDPHMIDYVFAGSELLERSRMEIGARNIWGGRSDHSPLIFDAV